LKLAFVSIPAYLSLTSFHGFCDLPVAWKLFVEMQEVALPPIGLGWAHGEQRSWISPELWDCLLYTPNFQHTLNFISHRGLG